MLAKIFQQHRNNETYAHNNNGRHVIDIRTHIPDPHNHNTSHTISRYPVHSKPTNIQRVYPAIDNRRDAKSHHSLPRRTVSQHSDISTRSTKGSKDSALEKSKPFISSPHDMTCSIFSQHSDTCINSTYESISPTIDIRTHIKDPHYSRTAHTVSRHPNSSSYPTHPHHQVFPVPAKKHTPKPSILGGKLTALKGDFKETIGRAFNKPELVADGILDQLRGDIERSEATYKYRSF